MTGLGTSTAVRLAQQILKNNLLWNKAIVETSYEKKKKALLDLKVARRGKISLKLVGKKMPTWERKCPYTGKENVQLYRIFLSLQQTRVKC